MYQDISALDDSNSAPRIVVLGDAIIDRIMGEDGATRDYPGGAGLNVAVDLTRLGISVTQIRPCADDQQGKMLANYLASHGVNVIPLQSSGTTGIATSWREQGEPKYNFSDAAKCRRYHLTAQAEDALERAALIAITAYPIEDIEGVSTLCHLMSSRGRRLVVDPNVRTDLTPDSQVYRQGLLRLAEVAVAVKLSEEDCDLLFEGGVDQAIPALLSTGTPFVVLTRGRHGATVFLGQGESVSVPAVEVNDDLVDTMGAGDAVLASLLADLASGSAYAPEEARREWTRMLERAMRLASIVIRAEGGTVPNVQLGGEGMHRALGGQSAN